MHPARLSFLAGMHEQPRAVVSVVETPSISTLTLECGHEQKIAPHFDCSREVGKTRGCRSCGETWVRNSPLYAAEFVDA